MKRGLFMLAAVAAACGGDDSGAEADDSESAGSDTRRRVLDERPLGVAYSMIDGGRTDLRFLDELRI